jgi:hypothetical protein
MTMGTQQARVMGGDGDGMVSNYHQPYPHCELGVLSYFISLHYPMYDIVIYYM